MGNGLRRTYGSLVFPGIPLFIGVIAVSFSAILIKVCQAPAAAIGMYRLLISALLLTPFTWYSARRGQDFARLTKRDVLQLLLSGMLLSLHFLFWIASLKETSVASSMVITTLQPAFVGILAYFVFRERLSRSQVLSLLIAFLGTITIAIGDSYLPGHDATGHIHFLPGTASALVGDGLSFLGTLCVSGYMIVGQHARSRLGSGAYNWIVFVVAGLFLLFYTATTKTPMTGYRHIDWLWLILLAVIPTIFGHALFNWLLRYVGATTISVTILFEPVGAILLSAWLLHEHIFIYQMLGGLLTLCGIWLYLSAIMRANKESPDVPRAKPDYGKS